MQEQGKILVGTPMICMKRYARGVSFGVGGGSNIDIILPNTIVYVASPWQQGDTQTLCLVYPGDYEQGNSSRADEPIDMCIKSCDLCPSHEHTQIRDLRAPAVFNTCVNARNTSGEASNPIII